jgi:LuxR family transcriptional regulator, maltose regulon positive regulatory protein
MYVPKPRRSVVPRLRLLETLRRGSDQRLTLVCAPAGFGKTTLLAEWLAEPGDARSVAWLSLEPADNDPVTFWTYVVSALQSTVPGVGSSALELLDASPLQAELVVTTLLNELGAAPHRVWLVLDDYHLIEDAAIRQAMAFLLEHLPRQVRVVLSTRVDPDLPLARWRVRGELVEIRARDLRFTPDEASVYLHGATGLDLSATDVAVLAERTEGWIAALQLAALSIQGRDDVSSFVAGFGGDNRYIVDYLVEEVLRHQPDRVREFLLYSAVLDRLTGSLCDALTGGDDGTQLLVELERANLFLRALDDRREWYRYHQLFADVLRARVLDERPDLVPQLHERASRWYEAHDSVDEAVTHALAARDFARAATLMELAVPAIRRHRTEAKLNGWLKQLPDETIRHSPVLSLFYGFMLMAAGDLDAVEPRLEDAERALAAVPAGSPPPWPDTEELRRVPATIAVYRASLAQARGDVAGTTAFAQRALDVADPDDHLARGAGAGFLGLAAWVQGDVSRAVETFTQAVESLHAAGNLVDELSSTVLLADMWLVAGRLRTARDLLERAMQVAEAHGDQVARATAELHVALSELDCEAGDVLSATRHLDAAAALFERTPTAEGRYRWFVASSRIAEAAGDSREALSLLDQAERSYLPGFFPNLRPIPAMKARIWIAHANLSQAEDWARDRGVSATDEASYLREFDHLTLVRLLLAQCRVDADVDKLDTALHLLAGLQEAAETAGRVGSLAEIRMLEVLALDAKDDRLRASAAVTPGRAAAPSAQPSLSHRELEVLRLLASELTGPEIAGQLFVSHNTLRTHTKHIFTKLDVTNRRAAVRVARERGLL